MIKARSVQQRMADYPALGRSATSSFQWGESRGIWREFSSKVDILNRVRNWRIMLGYVEERNPFGLAGRPSYAASLADKQHFHFSIMP